MLLQYNFDTTKYLFHFTKQNRSLLKKFIDGFADVQYMILCWWPHILKQDIFGIPKIGVINFHPSYLPYNRGKHYNFWTIVEGTKFGVTLHFIDEGIDTGDIIFQKQIIKDWTDTGMTLYHKAKDNMITLFEESYPLIRSGKYKKIKQDSTKASFHLASELDQASRIDLEKKYTARELINLLRAKTFPPHRGAIFEDEGKEYEIQIKISQIIN